ncbi:hypothetical protein SK128_004582 [Halocaridina rubra]|uniref:Uronyl 2-sulfotransferase n=1 Tax=Halocaridina rubra TaxID=373956 RepID=A0AAN9A6N8_HALRR
MANIPRPRYFITVLVWVATCCCLLLIWQVPPPPSLSSSSAYASSNARDFYVPAPPITHNLKPVSRTHVSNLLYLQPKNKQKTTTTQTRSSGAWLQNLATDKNIRTPSLVDSNVRSFSFPKLDSYAKITFNDKVQKNLGSSLTGYHQDKDPFLPINDPLSSHRSEVWDATPTDVDVIALQGGHDKRLPRQRHLEQDLPLTKPSNIVFSKHKWTKNLLATPSRDMNDVDKVQNDENRIYRSQEPEDVQDQETNEYEMNHYSDNKSEYGDGYSSYKYELYDVGKEDLGGKYNVTPPDASLLVYNRIPKCASSTMQTLLRKLSRHLNFEHVSSQIYNMHQLTQEEQEKLVENLTSSLLEAPSHALSYDRHLYYTNFTGLGLTPPVYINVVRDPVERFISSFYYRRSEERLSRIQMNGHPISPSFSWINRTVEQCVMLNDPECSFLPGEEKERILSYFCGHQEFCRIVGNHNALQVAKDVVSKEYSVVGLVEHMELSLKLMELLVPRFMEGALQTYENIRQREHMAVNVNQQKPQVSANIRETLHQRMSDDYDFYFFLEQRLFEQRKNFLSKR